ncbi:hypothetical protein ACFLRT_00455 [Acidobacteriota bacterium]
MYEKIMLMLDKGNDIFYNLISKWIKFRVQVGMIKYTKKIQCTALPIGGFQ